MGTNVFALEQSPYEILRGKLPCCILFKKADRHFIDIFKVIVQKIMIDTCTPSE